MAEKIKLFESQLSEVLNRTISEQLMKDDPNKFTTTLDRLHDVDIFGIESFLPGSQIDIKPIKDFKDIIASEVAIACFILSFVKITNTGIIIKPPPAPTSPVINPIKDPSANIISLLGARVFIFLILTIVLGDFLTIKNPATTIKVEKRSIINFSFVRIIRSVVKIISGISSIRYFLVIYTEIIAETEKNNVVL